MCAVGDILPAPIRFVTTTPSLISLLVNLIYDLLKMTIFISHCELQLAQYNNLYTLAVWCACVSHHQQNLTLF